MVIDPINDPEGARQKVKDSQLPPMGFGSPSDGVISTTLGGEPQNEFHTPIDSLARPLQLHDSYQDKTNNISRPEIQPDLSSRFDPGKYDTPKHELLYPSVQESADRKKNSKPENSLAGDYGQKTNPNSTEDFTYFLKNPDAPRNMNFDDMRDHYSQEKAPNNSTPTEPTETGDRNIT